MRQPLVGLAWVLEDLGSGAVIRLQKMERRGAARPSHQQSPWRQMLDMFERQPVRPLRQELHEPLALGGFRVHQEMAAYGIDGCGTTPLRLLFGLVPVASCGGVNLRPAAS